MSEHTSFPFNNARIDPDFRQRREYQMRRLAIGDYLLPANSVERTGRYYRLYRWKDGPHLGAERLRHRWTAFYTGRQSIEIDPELLRTPPWNDAEWTELGTSDTRREAVDHALQHDGVFNTPNSSEEGIKW